MKVLVILMGLLAAGGCVGPSTESDFTEDFYSKSDFVERIKGLDGESIYRVASELNGYFRGAKTSEQIKQLARTLDSSISIECQKTCKISERK